MAQRTPPTSRPAATPEAPARTLWQEGRHPGLLVVGGLAALLAVAALLTIVLDQRLGLFFDVVFVLGCVAAALLVRPRDFFTVGVLPPLALTATVVTLALLDRAAVARADDSLVQAVVSGLAHRAQALALGYALALAILGLRQVALRNQGRIRPRRDGSVAADTAAGDDTRSGHLV